jgi:hypothetical protein
MVTGNIPIPTIHVYKEINEGKYKGLKVRSGKKWQNLTGLFYTAINGVFIADKGKKNTKQDLIIVQFAKDNSRTLIVYYFNKYYTNDLKKVIQFINQ